MMKVAYFTDRADFNEGKENCSRYLFDFFNKNEMVDVSLFLSPKTINPSNYDFIIFRFDPGIQEDFYKHFENSGSGDSRFKFINHPRAILADKKSYLKQFEGLGILPEGVFSVNPLELAEFSRNRKVVVKPMDGFGGKGIHIIYENSSDKLQEFFNKLTQQGNLEYLVQVFIPEIYKTGDKRIHVVDGNPISAIARFPRSENSLANISSGGFYTKSELTSRDRTIADLIKNNLNCIGAVHIGLDVIGGYLTEINMTCPGLVKQCDDFSKIKISEELLKYMRSKL